MTILSYCRQPACTATAQETLQTAAQRMEKEGIGLLAVEKDGRLVGVVTDRDVALHVAETGGDAAVAPISDVMTRPPLSVGVNESIEDALARMARSHVRRLLVVDGDRVEGVVSADDLVLLLAREIGGLGEVLVAQLPAGASRAPGSEAEPGRPRRRAGDHQRSVVTALAETPLREVARKMQERAVGCVVVLGADGRAAGLVTDRDVALRGVAAGLDPATTAVGSVMSTPVTGAGADESLEEVVARMRTTGVRRIPLLDDGRPVGLVSFDDLLVTFGRELGQLAESVAGELRQARRRSYPALVREEIEERLEDVSTRLRTAGDQTWRALGRELEQLVERVGQALRGPSERPRTARLRVDDLMQRDVRTCTPEDALSEPARIMWERDCGCVPVLASDGSGRVVGMITDRDVCMASYTSHARLSEVQVKSAMSERIFACHPEDALAEAEAIMRSAQVRRLPVVDEQGHLRGVLSLADVAEAAAGHGAPAGTVSPAEVGVVLEAICRPRNQLVRQ